RDMNEPLVAAALFFNRLVQAAVDEVVDDPNLVPRLEHLHGLLAQILADTGDAVGLFDGEAGDGEVGPVGAHQGDIGAVQCGDEGQAAGRRQHVASQQRRNRVRDGVVDVQQVEMIDLGDLGHARGQREAVRRVLKQRVAGYFDLVVVNARAGAEANRVGVGNEMDVVAAVRQLNAKLSGDDAAAAVGGVAGDADRKSTRLNSSHA